MVVFYGAIFYLGAAAARGKGTGDRPDQMMLAGRALPLWMGIFTMSATWVGGGYINGTAEATASSGLVWVQAPWGYALSLVIGGVLFAGPMRRRGSRRCSIPWPSGSATAWQPSCICRRCRGSCSGRRPSSRRWARRSGPSWESTSRRRSSCRRPSPSPTRPWAGCGRWPSPTCCSWGSCSWGCGSSCPWQLATWEGWAPPGTRSWRTRAPRPL